MARRKDELMVKRTPKRGTDVGHAAAEAATTTVDEDVRLLLPEGATTTADDDRAPDSLRQDALSLAAETDLGRYQLLFELARGGTG